MQYLGPFSSLSHRPELAIFNMIVAAILLLLIDGIYAQCGFRAYPDVSPLEKGTLITRRRMPTLQIFVPLLRTPSRIPGRQPIALLLRLYILAFTLSLSRGFPTLHFRPIHFWSTIMVNQLRHTPSLDSVTQFTPGELATMVTNKFHTRTQRIGLDRDLAGHNERRLVQVLLQAM